ncbi:FAR1-related protein [Sesbania bispinosa]|nr:FAR1-related protein [Sesbania bispinosa]
MDVACSCCLGPSWRIEEFPIPLILRRWTKGAKDDIVSCGGIRPDCWEIHKLCRRSALLDYYMTLFECETYEEWLVAKEEAIEKLERLKAKRASQYSECESENLFSNKGVGDLVRASTKGRGTPGSSCTGIKLRRKTHSYCKRTGHNRVTCNQCLYDSQVDMSDTKEY